MTKKVFTDDRAHPFLRKQDLHAEHPVDIKTTVPHNEVGPRSPATHISIRLNMDVCDWIWGLYPNEPTISSAVQRYIKEQYGLLTQASSV